MEDFLIYFPKDDSIVLDKLKLLYEICNEISNHSRYTLEICLGLLLKKYNIPQHEVERNDIGTQVDFDNDLSGNNWNCENIADDVATVAKKNLEENGFVYDQNTGLYYDHKFQCYYNPELKLYYYHQTGAYYYYDEDSQSLKYYCKASTETGSPKSANNNIGDIHETDFNPELSQRSVPNEFSNEESTKRNHSSVSEKITKKAKEDYLSYDKEEGECSESEEEMSPGPVVIEAGPKTFEPDHSKHIAPCIRVLVKSSLLNDPRPGTLFIVTCTGGTLGREGEHDILIPDQLVSKLHSSFRYVYKDGTYFYEITDMGSKNGTYLNGKRLSDSLVESDPIEITHGSVITVGNTDLLCHIHSKGETCQECEAYNISNEEKKQDLSNELTLKEKYSQELSVIRKKFGILNSSVAKFPPGYEDRADIRRKKVGSSHSSEKTVSSSVDVPIDKRNKGFALMTKMGWVEGTGLGKNDGIIEPISMDGNEGKLGLGCDDSISKINVSKKETKKMVVAKKTLERFQHLP